MFRSNVFHIEIRAKYTETLYFEPAPLFGKIEMFNMEYGTNK